MKFHNLGVCATSDGGFECNCPIGYSGALCQITPCTNSKVENAKKYIFQISRYFQLFKNRIFNRFSPCQNSAECWVSTRTQLPEAVCKCPLGFSGEYCEITPCTNSPCKNDGTCRVADSSYECDCIEGFSGKSCEISPCFDDPCGSNGFCEIVEISNSTFGYSCECEDGYTGSHCEISPCDKNPCFNNGKCFVENGKHLCECDHGYSGENCEISPCSTRPCQNGAICSG